MQVFVYICAQAPHLFHQRLPLNGTSKEKQWGAECKHGALWLMGVILCYISHCYSAGEGGVFWGWYNTLHVGAWERCVTSPDCQNTWRVATSCFSVSSHGVSIGCCLKHLQQWQMSTMKTPELFYYDEFVWSDWCSSFTISGVACSNGQETFFSCCSAN